MTHRETHEIALTTDELVRDEHIVRLYSQLTNGSMKGFRKYVRNELVAFWADGDPYLDKRYLDFSNMVVGSRIINLDDTYCWVRDAIEEDLKAAKTADNSTKPNNKGKKK